MPAEIVVVTTKSDVEEVRRLFFEYAEDRDLNLDLDGIDRDFLELPGNYAMPDGLLLLALYGKEPVRCVGLLKINQSVCEIRRLFVKQECRGKGIGRQLIIHTIEHARSREYKKIRLDTTIDSKAAISLFASLRFIVASPYPEDSAGEAVFMELDLEP